MAVLAAMIVSVSSTLAPRARYGHPGMTGRRQTTGAGNPADKPRNEITHEIKTAPLHGIGETSAYQETAQHKKYDNGRAVQTGNEIKQFQE
jgi:hypothetical protein